MTKTKNSTAGQLSAPYLSRKQRYTYKNHEGIGMHKRCEQQTC